MLRLATSSWNGRSEKRRPIVRCIAQPLRGQTAKCLQRPEPICPLATKNFGHRGVDFLSPRRTACYAFDSRWAHPLTIQGTRHVFDERVSGSFLIRIESRSHSYLLGGSSHVYIYTCTSSCADRKAKPSKQQLQTPSTSKPACRTARTSPSFNCFDGFDGDDLQQHVQSLTYPDFRTLSPAEIQHLTTDQVASIPNYTWFVRIPEESRAALTQQQLRALDVESIGLRPLSDGQIKVLRPDQIQTLSYDSFRYLVGTQTRHLTPTQVSTIPDGWWFGRISEEGREALTDDQVRALDVGVVGLKLLNADQVDALTIEQIQTLAYDTFMYLDADQTPHLTGDQVGSIPSGWWLQRMDEETRDALTGDQIRTLDTSDVGLKYLNEQQIVELTPDQVQDVD